MSIYVMSDIHGQLEAFTDLFTRAKINLNVDELHILGDFVDWGDKSCELMLKLLKLKNKYPNNLYLYIGNHDIMMKDAIDKGLTLDDVWYNTWGNNKGSETYQSYLKLTNLKKMMIQDFLNGLEAYRTLNIQGKNYYLTHSIPLLDHLEEDRDYEIERAVWGRVWAYERIEYPSEIPSDTILVSGHTMIHHIGKHIPGFNLRKNSVIWLPTNRICIDCGAKGLGMDDKYRLAVLNLNNNKALYNDTETWRPIKIFTRITKDGLRN